MAFETLRYDVADGIATIAMDQPDTRNALSDELLGDLLDAFAAARERRDCSIRRELAYAVALGGVRNVQTSVRADGDAERVCESRIARGAVRVAGRAVARHNRDARAPARGRPFFFDFTRARGEQPERDSDEDGRDENPLRV